MSEQQICRPELHDWPGVIAQSRVCTHILSASVPVDLRQRIRQELFEAASAYCAEWGLSKPAYQATSPVVAFGHQPLVYHSGLFAKQQKILEFLQHNSANALEVVIDTDQGSPAEVVLIQKQPIAWETIKIAVTEGQGPYLFHKLLTEFDTAAILQDQDNAHSVKLFEFLAALKELSTRSPAYALSYLRHKFLHDQRTLVLPLSMLMRLAAIQELTSILLVDPIELQQVYNKTLTDFRTAHKIKNAANPFPNLELRDDLVEMPFWVIDLKDKFRSPLFFHKQEQRFQLETRGPAELSSLSSLLSSSDILLAPRGMLTTFIFRVFCSDLFVHGLGGEKYDPATDQFIKNTIAVDIAPFVTVSNTRYLLHAQVKELEHLDQLLAKQREFYNHPQLALDLIDNQVDRHQLEQLITAAKNIRERMLQSKSEGLSVADLQNQLSAANLAVRALLDKLIFMPAQSRIAQLEHSRTALFNRNISYFIF